RRSNGKGNLTFRNRIHKEVCEPRHELVHVIEGSSFGCGNRKPELAAILHRCELRLQCSAKENDDCNAGCNDHECKPAHAHGCSENSAISVFHSTEEGFCFIVEPCVLRHILPRKLHV